MELNLEDFFLDKTHLSWFSDYLIFLLTVYKYSINFDQLGNNFNKQKKGFTFGDIISWLVKEEDIRKPNSRTQLNKVKCPTTCSYC